MNAPENWVKAENDNSFLFPELGAAWAKMINDPEVPVTYSPVKFNNGIVPSYWQYFVKSFVLPAQFSIEWWGRWDIPCQNGDFYWWQYGNEPGGFCVEIYNKGFYPFMAIPYTQGKFVWPGIWELDEQAHFVITFNWLADPGERIRCWYNKVELEKETIYGESDWRGQTLNLSTQEGIAGPRAGFLDNPKIFLNYLLIQEDVDILYANESWQPAPGGRVLMPKINRAKGMVA